MDPIKLIDDIARECRTGYDEHENLQFNANNRFVFCHRLKFNGYPTLFLERRKFPPGKEDRVWSIFACVSTPWGKIKASCKWNYDYGFKEGRWINTTNDQLMLFKLSRA